MANRPAIQGWVRSKDTGKNINIFAFWDGEYGLSGKFSDDVVSINVTTQTGELITIEPNQVYLNGKLEAQYLATELSTPKPSATPNVSAPTADEIPF
jgi:hypothetical protein